MPSPLDRFTLIEDGNGQIRYSFEGNDILFLGAEAVSRMDEGWVRFIFNHALGDVISSPDVAHSYPLVRDTIKRTVPHTAYDDLFLNGLSLDRPNPAFDSSPNAAIEIVEFRAPLKAWSRMIFSQSKSSAFSELKSFALKGYLPLDYFGFIGLARGEIYVPDEDLGFKRRPYRVAFDGRVHSLGVETSVSLEEHLGDAHGHLGELIDRIRSTLDPEREPERFPVPVTNLRRGSIALGVAEIEATLRERYPSFTSDSN